MKREHSPEFKRRIAIEAIKERHTINEIASKNNIHPGQVSQWKRQLLDSLKGIFEHPARARNRQKNKELIEAKLHEKIGQLTIELDWLKKKMGI